MAYRSANLAFRMDAKDIKKKDDIKKIKNGALRKIATEYIRIAERSVSRIPSSAIVNRQVESMSLIGWRYVSIMPFVETMEMGLVFVGVILALSFNEFAFMYGVLAAGGFIVVKIITAIFDFRAAKNRYTDELLIYVEREVGHFFASDAGGAVLRLKNELTEAIDIQSETMQDTIDKIGEIITNLVNATEAVKTSGDNIMPVYEALLKQSHYLDLNQKTLEATVLNYENALQNMAKSLGEGITTYLQLGAESAAESINGALNAGMERIISSNREVMATIENLSGQLLIQQQCPYNNKAASGGGQYGH